MREVNFENAESKKMDVIVLVTQKNRERYAALLGEYVRENVWLTKTSGIIYAESQYLAEAIKKHPRALGLVIIDGSMSVELANRWLQVINNHTFMWKHSATEGRAGSVIDLIPTLVVGSVQPKGLNAYDIFSLSLIDESAITTRVAEFLNQRTQVKKEVVF